MSVPSRGVDADSSAKGKGVVIPLSALPAATDFVKAIADWRRRTGGSILDLAEEARVGQGSVWRLASGRGGVTGAVMWRVWRVVSR
jgi:hypothetical protein